MIRWDEPFSGNRQVTYREYAQNLSIGGQSIEQIAEKLGTTYKSVWNALNPKKKNEVPVVFPQQKDKYRLVKR
jgi:DNA-binding CsgD family transcriptional regulator